MVFECTILDLVLQLRVIFIFTYTCLSFFHISTSLTTAAQWYPIIVKFGTGMCSLEVSCCFMQMFWEFIMLIWWLFPDEKQVNPKADCKLTLPCTKKQLYMFSASSEADVPWIYNFSQPPGLRSTFLQGPMSLKQLWLHRIFRICWQLWRNQR